MTNNPKKTDAFVYYGYDLKVVDQVPIVAPEWPSGGATSTPSATRWATCFRPIPAATAPPDGIACHGLTTSSDRVNEPRAERRVRRNRWPAPKGYRSLPALSSSTDRLDASGV